MRHVFLCCNYSIGVTTKDYKGWHQVSAARLFIQKRKQNNEIIIDEVTDIIVSSYFESDAR